MRAALWVLAVLAVALAGAPAARADDAALSLQLNAAATVDGACRVTFVARNDLDTPLAALGLDLVIFDKDGGVADYAAIDLGALPAGKTRVRQYDVSARPCETIARLLVNDVRVCDGAGLTPPACLARLAVSSRLSMGLEL